MCTSKPKPPPAPVQPQTYSPEIRDQDTLAARDREQRRRRAQYGRQSTILAGEPAQSGLPPTGAYKTALGA